MSNMDPLVWLRKQLQEAEPDLLREMLRSLAEALLAPRQTRSAGPASASAPASA